MTDTEEPTLTIRFGLEDKDVVLRVPGEITMTPAGAKEVFYTIQEWFAELEREE